MDEPEQSDSIESAETLDAEEGFDSVEKELKALLDAADLDGPAVSAPMVGETIAQTYTLIGRLGEGGMGTVYLARHARTGGQLALKLIKASRLGDSRAIRRFELEAKHTASLHHPNIVRVFDYGKDDDLVYLAMEYVPGTSVAEMLDEQGTIDWRKAVEIATQVLGALSAAHESDQQIIHRDIKPANILVTDREDDAVFAKVLDFGIARALEGPSANTQGVIGSPQSMAPEQFDGGTLSPATDLYALGCTMYAMLSGRPPFTGTFSQLAMKHCHESPPPLEEVLGPGDVPASLIEWVELLMRKDPSERPSSAREALRMLRELELELPAEATAPKREPSTGRPRRARTIVAVTVLVALVVAVATALFIRGELQREQDVAAPAASEGEPVVETTTTPPDVKHEPLTLSQEYFQPGMTSRLSPEGERVLFLRDHALEIVSLENGAVTTIPLPKERSYYVASWFPDGQHVLTSESGTDQPIGLWKTSLDGERTRLIDGGVRGMVSPDGKRLAFLTSRAGTGPWRPSLMLANADGSDIQRIVSPSVVKAGPIWLRDNSAIVYATTREANGRAELRVANADVNQTVQTDAWLDYGGEVVLTTLSGRRILYNAVDLQDGERPVSNLRVVRLDDDLRGLGSSPVTDTRGFVYSRVSTNADGSEVLYCRLNKRMDIEVGRRSDGGLTDVRPLDGTSRFERPTDWSEDGERLLFMSNRTGRWQAYEQGVRSPDATQLTATAGWATWPRYAPGDDAVLFWQTELGETSVTGIRLMIRERDGDTRQLTERVFGEGAPRRAGQPYPRGVDVRCTGTGGECVLHEVTELHNIFYRLDLESGALERAARVPRPDSDASDAHAWALRSTAPEIVVASRGHDQMRLISLESGEVEGTISLPDPVVQVQYLQWDPAGDGMLLSGIFGDPNYRVGLLDSTGHFQALVTSTTDWLAQVQVAPGGERIAWLRTRTDCPPWKLEIRQKEAR